MSHNSQFNQAGQIVERLQAVLGKHPGYRVLHADGRLYRGTFEADPIAQTYTRAVHLQGGQVPVTVRFSKGGGDPFSHFSNTVGMATRFYLPDGEVTNLVMLSQKLFFARSVEQFLDLLDSARPLTEGGPLNKEGLDEALKRHPNVAEVFRIRAATPAPVSFAKTSYNSVHAFIFVNAAGDRTPARLHWRPVAGEEGQPIKQLSEQDKEVLFGEFEERLAREVVRYDLELELAQAGDPLDDATALWPDDRERVTIGRMTLSQVITEADIGDPVMNHDPTKLVDGIEATDDPIIQIRRGIYENSAAQRTGGWRKGCPMAGQ